MLMPFAFQQGASVAAWTPASLGTSVLYGWYKADVGTGVSTDGANVATWNDQSGNSRNLAQVTTAKQPKFRTSANGVNGLPVVEFSPSTSAADLQNMVDTGFTGDASAGFSFYIVYRTTATGLLYSTPFGIGSSASGGSIFPRCSWPGNPNVINLTLSALGDYDLGAYSTNFNALKISRPTTLAATKYKTTYMSAAATPVHTWNLPNGFYLGGTEPGTAGSNTGSVGAKIAEVIVCTRELTTGSGSEEASLNTYLRARYGFDLDHGVDLPVASPALWLDGSRWDTLYDGSATPALVTVDSGAIQTANDLSGNGLNATQTTLGNRPTYRTPVNGQNGLSAIQHSSTGWYFTTASASLGEYTAFSVMTSGWAGTNYRAVFGHDYNSSTQIGQALMATGSALQDWQTNYLFAAGYGYPMLHNPRAMGPHGTLASGSAQLITAVIGSAGSTVRLNGASVVTAASNAAVTATSAAYYIGNSGPLNDYHDGKTCETIIYPRLLNSTEIGLVEAYLKAKWATP